MPSRTASPRGASERESRVLPLRGGLRTPRPSLWQLQAGRAVKDIELSEAEAFAESLGFPAPAKPEEAETGEAQLQQTKSFD